MTDRELLEWAAKAAGMDVTFFGDASNFDIVNSDDQSYWNPITDDGDALRLAVALGIRFSPVANKDDCCAGITFEPGGAVTEPRGNDPYAATRRAIVRAAAEIGKAMP